MYHIPMSLCYNSYNIYILVLHAPIPQDHPRGLIKNYKIKLN
jgi:hypothetical protein